MDRTMQTTIVCDGSRLKEIDIGMALEFVQGEFIDVQFLWMGIADDEIGLGLGREILDFIELVDADIATQALSILNNLTSK